MPQRVVSNQKNKKKTKWSNWWLNRTRLLLLLCILTISVSLRYACLLNFPANDWAAPIIISTLVVVVVLLIVFAPQPHLGSCRNWLEFTASGYKIFFRTRNTSTLVPFCGFHFASAASDPWPVHQNSSSHKYLHCFYPCLGEYVEVFNMLGRQIWKGIKHIDIYINYR